MSSRSRRQAHFDRLAEDETQSALSPCVQRMERSTPLARLCPVREAINSTRWTDAQREQDERQSPTRRTGPRTEALESTPSIRPVLLAEDQRQTPQWQRSLLGEARATGIMHPGFYGRKPWKSQTVPLLLPDRFGVEYALEAIPPKSVDSGHINVIKTYRKVHVFRAGVRGIVAVPHFRQRPRVTLFKSSALLRSLRVSERAVLRQVI